MSLSACVIDTSVLVALLYEESDADSYWHALGRFERHCIPASVYLEFVMVTNRRAGSRQWLDDMIAAFRVQIEPVDRWVAGEAADAFERYGRGTGHPARLNFGDCLSYAVARKHHAPLLFKGEDFAHTDVKRAL